MKRSLLVAGVVAAVIAAWSVGRVQGQNEMKKVVYVSSDQANYTTKVKGVSMAKIWGDADMGRARHFYQVRSGTGFGDAHAHQRYLDRGVEGRLFVQGRRGRKASSRGRLLTRPRWDTNTGAAATQKRERCSMRNRPGKFDLIPVK